MFVPRDLLAHDEMGVCLEQCRFALGLSWTRDRRAVDLMVVAIIILT